ncbi:MAG: SPFH domain-containing protein [Bacteroidota bacterium]
MKYFGYVRVNPSDYVIRLKGGKISREGRGMNFFNWPNQQYVVIPSIVSNIPFVADQITQENQGVEVSGFAIWKIGHPSKVYLHFDFTGKESPVEKINRFLKDVVESAIRHQVANMTIEEVLRKRGSIILQLKKELEYISDQWGIAIETIEIKNVKIMSEQLFKNMQATFRDAIRLESETSALKTEEEISQKKLAHKERMAILEQEAQQKEAVRKAELEQQALRHQSELTRQSLQETKSQKILESNSKVEVAEQEDLNKRKLLALQLETLAEERKLEQAVMSLDIERKQNDNKLRELELIIDQKRLDLSNQENPQHLMFKMLPEILGSLKISELNIGQEELAGLLQRLLAGKSEK